MGDNAGGGRQGPCEFRQSDFTVLCNQFFKQPLVRSKLAMTLRAALNIRRDRPRLAPLTLLADTRCRRQFQTSRRCATA